MALGGITDTVHTFHNGIHRRVVSYRRVRTIKVVVDGTRQSDDRHIILFGKHSRTCQRTVTTDDHQRIDFLLLHVFESLVATFRSHELFRARRLQYRSSKINDSRHVFGGKTLYLAVDESIPSAIDTLDFIAVVDTGTCHGTYGRIHSRSITT